MSAMKFVKPYRRFGSKWNTTASQYRSRSNHS
jgi:hypothetical protein